MSKSLGKTMLSERIDSRLSNKENARSRLGPLPAASPPQDVFLARLAVLWTQQALRDCEEKLAQATAKCGLLQRNNANLHEIIRRSNEEKVALESSLSESKDWSLRMQKEFDLARTGLQQSQQAEARQLAERMARLEKLEKENQLCRQTIRVSDEQNSLLKTKLAELQQRLSDEAGKKARWQKEGQLFRTVQFQQQALINRLSVKHRQELQVVELQLARARQECRVLSQALSQSQQGPDTQEDKMQHFRRVIKVLEDRLDEMFESKKTVVAEYNTLKGQYIELRALYEGNMTRRQGRGERTSRAGTRRMSLAEVERMRGQDSYKSVLLC